jgi:hypothetical protein
VKHHAGLPDFDRLKQWATRESPSSAELDKLREFANEVRGWLYWYGEGGGAGKTLNGIKEALYELEES